MRVCLQGHQPFMAAARAVHATLKALREGTPAERLQGIADEETMKHLMRNEDYVRWARDYL